MSSQLDVFKNDGSAYDYVGSFDGGWMPGVLKSDAVAEALGTGEHEVFAAWTGQYGKRFRVNVGNTSVEEL